MLDVVKSFGKQKVLNNVSLSVEPGEIFTILGPSGCGKTTLLRIVAGLELPDKGTILLNADDITKRPASRRPINTVFQSYALFPHLNVFDNVAFGLKAQGFADDVIGGKVYDILEILQMTGLDKRRPHELSGGQKQRVALARALVNEPLVLLLDEPMSALDAHLRTQVQDELRSLQRRLGTTFVMVTHDQNEAKMLSNRLAVMNEGEIVQFGTTKDVFSTPKNKFVAEFLGATKNNIIDATYLGGNKYHTPFCDIEFASKPSWEKGEILIWPERLQVSPEIGSDGTNYFTGEIRDLFYNGQGLDFMIAKEPGASSKGTPLSVKARTSSEMDIRNGQKVGVYFPPDDIVPLQ
jgi:spermidine/putrescine transport system ATP-binding protein